MSETLRVVLAYAYTGKDGKTFEPDAEVDLPVGIARELLHFGRARVPEPKKAAPAVDRKDK